MGKIFCILGKSGTGKDTIFKNLINDSVLSLKSVVTYTTRPQREGEKEGVEYHFITDDRLKSLKAEGKLIELREYKTVKGIWSYCTVNDDQIDINKGNYLMIVTPDAFLSLSRFFGHKTVVPIYIFLEDGIRLERALNRERQSGKPDYNEMCRRFLADVVDFSDEKLLLCGIKQYYENCDLDTCIELIKHDIKSHVEDNKK